MSKKKWLRIFTTNISSTMNWVNWMNWVNLLILSGVVHAGVINRLKSGGEQDIFKASSLEFPRWLKDFTGLSEWPGIDPPYIPLDFIDFNVPTLVPIHKQGQCDMIPNDVSSVCSFDCHNCVSFDDIHTCSKLSQTFDDGPSQYTPQLLRQLDKTNTKSTFFTIGLNIIRYPEIYLKTYQKNHIMASHTWSHPFLPSLTNEQIVAQLQWSIWAMNATAGHLPKWFRPPYGGVDNRVRYFIRQFGMQLVLWDFDTFDWKTVGDLLKNDETILRDVKTFQKEKNNQGIILEHDSLSQTVSIGIKLNQHLPDQLTIPQCVGGIDYIKQFPR